MTINSRILCSALAVVLAAATQASAQAEARKLFQAGQFQQVVEAAEGDAQPSVIYLAALSHQKAGAVDQAVMVGRRLADLPDDNAWHFVGQSLVELLQDQTDPALDSARRAVNAPGAPPEAHYQLGLVLARKQEWREAAESFDRVTQADPTNAYAYYYSGLMHSRSNRTDLMGVRFERFLKLAPEAPERPEVQQIMRTVRGR